MFQRLKKSIQIFNLLNQNFAELDASNVGNNRKQHIMIPIFYWGDTYVGWIQIIFALRFAKHNAHIYFVYDDDLSGMASYSLNFFLMKTFIKKICGHSDFDLLVSNHVPEKKDCFNELILKKHYFNAQWQQKRAIKFSEFELEPSVIELDQVVAAKIDHLLMSNSCDLCFCPGGIYGNSYLWRAICDTRSVRFSSFDGDKTKLIVTSSGLAAHRSDIAARCQMSPVQDIKKLLQQIRSDIHKRSKLTLNKLKALHDRKTWSEGIEQEVEAFFHGFSQNVSRGEVLKNAVIFLNTSWDSAALDLEPWDVSQSDWLDLLVAELIQSGCRNLVIRQHPDEQFYPSRDKYRDQLKIYQDIDRRANVRLIDAHQEVNSYELIRESSIVFTFASTIGLEACVLNRPTFVFKDNYQSKLGALPRYTPGNLNVNLDRYFKDYRDFQLKSALAYYHGQLCGWHDISIPDVDIFLSEENWSEMIDNLAIDVMLGPVVKDV